MMVVLLLTEAGVGQGSSSGDKAALFRDSTAFPTRGGA